MFSVSQSRNIYFNSETSSLHWKPKLRNAWDSEKAFLHGGDVLGFVVIAGRAGRRSSIYPKGFVGTRASADLPTVTSALNMPLNMLSTPAAGLFPEFQHLELLAGQVCLRRPGKLSLLLSCFSSNLLLPTCAACFSADSTPLQPHGVVLIRTLIMREPQC